jgi:tripartite-type tricarboxylate transporter receptor subunit TctC
MRAFSQFRWVSFFALALSALWPEAPHAQDWPLRPITLVVAFAPGSPSDFAARAIAHDLSNTLGQPVVVENKAGSGGVIASITVAKAAPDGYTLLLTAIGPAIQRPLIDKTLPYDTFKDFVPIVLTDDTPNVLLAKPDSNLKSVQDVIAYAKANPGKLTIGHPGLGTMGHLIALMFANEADITANFVAYQGPPAIISDVLGGHIDIGSIAYGGSNGLTTILAVTTDESVSFLPDVPTMKQSHLPNVIGSTWHAVLAPVGTPSEIISKLNNAVNAFLAKEDTKQQFDKFGFRILGGTPERLAKQMADDRTKWSKVIEKAHLSQN